MTTAAKSTLGITLKRDDNLIAEITNLTGPELSLETIDVTSHDSADDFREYIGGLLDGGEIQIEGIFKAADTSGQIGLQTDMLAKTLQTFVLTFPTSVTATWTFTALVTRFKASDFPLDDAQRFSATLKISGKPVLAITASADITALAIAATSGAIALSPDLTAAVYTYGCTVGTGDAFVKLTITDATAASIKVTALGVEWNLTSAVESGNIVIDAADTITDVKIEVTDTGKVTKTYHLYVVRPAA